MEIVWTEGKLAQLRRMLAEEVSIKRIALVLGSTVKGVHAAIHYHILGERKPPQENLRSMHGRNSDPYWTEARLTEPWKEYSARKKQERLQAPRSMPEVRVEG